jgi:hydroxypyruvate reductase
MSDQRVLLQNMFKAAVAAVVPARCLAPYLPDPAAVKGEIVIVGAGKAAAEMARIAGEHFGPQARGLVVTRYGHGADGAVPPNIEVIEAAHPVPDQAGLGAAVRMIDMVSGLGPDDLIVCLLSGGGSALLSAPAAGLTLDDKQAVTAALLRSGATISEINCIRKHLSKIKGGRLVAAAPTPLLTLAISDVPGDDPAVIASGPTVADPTSFADAQKLLRKFDISGPQSVLDHIAEALDETPKAGDPRLAGATFKMIATPAAALDAAAAMAREAGYLPVVLGDDLEGESREVAARHAGLALECRAKGERCAILSGGETTVTIRAGSHSAGRGGPNAEYALALAIALRGAQGLSAIACDTDGIDGSEDNAGAIISPETLRRARALGLDPDAFLQANDSYGFFQPLDDLVMTGPTRTNINDFRAILVA